jgi:Holliday junction resolvasome RuvABC DNA-binding subunit
VTEAKQALRQLGYPSVIADAAVTSASAHVGTNVDLPTLIKEALRRCGSA